jgi:hypothetical protein
MSLAGRLYLIAIKHFHSLITQSTYFVEKATIGVIIAGNQQAPDE